MASDHTLGDWIRWLDDGGLLHPVAPPPYGTCVTCLGPVGDPAFTQCPQCHGLVDDPLDAFVPIAYSTDDTLESMLHRFKDWKRHQWGDYSWLRLPLGAVLAGFWNQHGACLETEHGPFDLVVGVPGDDRERGFDQLAAINQILEKPTLDLVSGVIARNLDEERPARREVRPTAYSVLRPDAVRGARVLLLDDTWTSGASMRSAAGALKDAGAATVVGLTLGRQLNGQRGWGTTQMILDQLSDRTSAAPCLYCA